MNFGRRVTKEINNLCSIEHLANNNPEYMCLKERIKWLIELKLKILKKGCCYHCNYDNFECICNTYCSICDESHNGKSCDKNVMNSNTISLIMYNINLHLQNN